MSNQSSKTTNGQQGFFNKLSARIENRRNKIDRRLELRRLRRLRHNKPPYKHCKNCGTELHGTYCHYCGQYAYNTKQSFWSFLKFYFTETYLIDPKIGPTLVELFRRPGYLTRAFWEGKISSYTNPLRLNMFLLIFAVIALFASQESMLDSDEPTAVQTKQLMSQAWSIQIRMEEFRTYDEILVLVESSPKCEATLIAPLAVIKKYPDILPIKDEISCIATNNLDTMLVDMPTYFIDEQIVTKTPSGEYIFVKLNSFLNDSTILKEAENSFTKIFPIIALLLIPFITIGIKLFNNQPHLTYVNHFTFALHYVAFFQICLLFYTLITCDSYGSITDGLLLAILVFTPIVYLTFAYKRAYQTGWFKSVVKAALTSLLYSILLWLTISIITTFHFINNNPSLISYKTQEIYDNHPVTVPD